MNEDATGSAARDEFFRAIEAGESDSVRRLLDRDPSLVSARNAAGVSGLMTALYHRHQEVADTLRAAHAALDVFEAAALDDTQRLGALVEEQADRVHARSPDGFTPLHLACFFDRPEAARILLARGADADTEAANPSRVRPLHSAAAARSTTCARLLVDHGCNISAQQAGGWTALQAASLHGLSELVTLLLQAGADPRQAADDGRNAITMARGSGHAEVVKLLESAAPDPPRA